MSIKLSLLKTGEQLISEMKELVPEDQEQVHAYLLDNPHTVEINEKQFVTEEEKKSGDFGIDVILKHINNLGGNEKPATEYLLNYLLSSSLKTVF